MLSHIFVDHFKSLSQIDMKLGSLTVICGKNSTGKSNILESITFLRDAIQNGLDEATSDRHGIESILQWSPSRPFNMDLRAHFTVGEGTGQYHLKISSKGREPYVLEESASWREANEKAVSYKRMKNNVQYSGVDDQFVKFAQVIIGKPDDQEIVLPNAASITARNNSSFFLLRRAIISFELYSIFPNTIRMPQKPATEFRLSPSGDNLLSVLKMMATSKSSAVKSLYQEIISMMRQIIPNLERIQVKNIGGLLWPLFDVKEQSGKIHQFNVSQISDGALRILGILVALYQPHPPNIVALEEPEQNVHPGFLGLLADAFKDFSRKSQIIITTHSPNLIDYFDVESLYVVDFTDGQTRVGSVSASQKEAVKTRLLTAGEIMTVQGLEAEIN